MTPDILSLPPLQAQKRLFYGKDSNQFLDLWEPSNARALVMMVHGGFWRARYDLLHVSHLCGALARHDIVLANLEYRRVGNSGGGWPGTYDDIRAGFVFLQQQFPTLSKFVVVGHSAGGHLALRLASDTSALTGVVALAPVAVLRTAYDLHLSRDAVVDFLSGKPNEIPQIYKDACPSQHASQVRRLLIHGTQDEEVPLAISLEFCQKRAEDPGLVTLSTLEDVNHFELIDPRSAACQTVMEAVLSLL